MLPPIRRFAGNLHRTETFPSSSFGVWRRCFIFIREGRSSRNDACWAKWSLSVWNRLFQVRYLGGNDDVSDLVCSLCPLCASRRKYLFVVNINFRYIIVLSTHYTNQLQRHNAITPLPSPRYPPMMMLLIGIWMSFTKNPMNPITKNPTVVALATCINSLHRRNAQYAPENGYVNKTEVDIRVYFSLQMEGTLARSAEYPTTLIKRFLGWWLGLCDLT